MDQGDTHPVAASTGYSWSRFAYGLVLLLLASSMAWGLGFLMGRLKHVPSAPSLGAICGGLLLLVEVRIRHVLSTIPGLCGN